MMQTPAAGGGEPGVASSTRARHIALVVAVGLIARLYLIYRYPSIFGDDTIARLIHADHIVLSHDLPLLQILIHYLQPISRNPLLVRWCMAGVGSVAGAGFYMLLSDLVSPSVALDGSLLFVANPFILADSVVPYQEIVMLAGLVFAFHFAFTERWPLASLSLGVACLTRYEAWLACPVLACAFAWKGGLGVRSALAGIALFGWAPLGWMAYNRGITPAGSYAIEWSSNPERALRWAHLAAVTVRNSPLPALILAGVGTVTFWRRRLFAERPYRMLTAFLALLLVAILFSAHGIGDQPERVVTQREAHVPLTAVTVLAALGLSTLPRFRRAAAALTVVVSLAMADRYVRRQTSEPHLALSYRVARYLDGTVAPAEQVVVLAQPIQAEDALARIERRRGAGAVRRTLATVRALGMVPSEYGRILVHTRLNRDQVRTYATLELGRFADGSEGNQPAPAAQPSPRRQWLVQWSDFVASNPIEAGLAAAVASEVPRQVFAQDNVWVRLYTLPR